MSVHSQRTPQQTAPQQAAPQQTPASDAGTPEWNYQLSMGNSAVLAMISGGATADEQTATSLLHGTLDPAAVSQDAPAAEQSAPAAEQAAPAAEQSAPVQQSQPGQYDFAEDGPEPAAPQRQAPPTLTPTGVYRKPFQKHQAQVPKAKLALSNSQKAELTRFQNLYAKNKARYEAVSAKTGVPPELIAAIHYRESSMNFGTYLHQGDPLGRKAVHVPRNIPIFHKWEDAAVHALNMKKGLRDQLGMTSETTDEVAMASYAEAYNGLGYYNKGLTSAYVYAGTDQYKGGMYVADGKFSRSARDRRLGTVALIKGIQDQEHTTGSAAPAPVEDTQSENDAWEGVLSGHIMRKGVSGAEVKALQQKLTAAGFTVPATGYFGPQTEAAVKSFQRSKGLTPDGVVGSDTAAALDGRGPTPAPTPEGGSSGEASTTPSAPVQQAPAQWSRVLSGALLLSYGAQGEVVKFLQGLLAKKGYQVKVDGFFGRATGTAVRAFQRASGLRPDGMVGDGTASKLQG